MLFLFKKLFFKVKFFKLLKILAYLLMKACIFLILFKVTFSWSIIIDKIVAKVNGEIITLSKVNQIYENVQENSFEWTKEQILKLLIDDKIIFQLASDNDLNVELEEINKEINFLKKRYGTITNNDLLKKLQKNKKITIDLLYYEIKKNKIQQKLIQFIFANNMIKKPTEKEMINYYKENQAAFYEKEKVKIAHILLRLLNKDINLIQVKEKLIEKIVEVIKLKTDVFSNLAKKYSEDLNSKNRGGLLGWFDFETLNQLSKEYSIQAFNMNIGEISEVIYTDQGISLLYLLDKQSSKKREFEEARSFIQNKISQNRALNKLLIMLKAKKKQSSIEIFGMINN